MTAEEAGRKTKIRRDVASVRQALPSVMPVTCWSSIRSVGCRQRSSRNEMSTCAGVSTIQRSRNTPRCRERFRSHPSMLATSSTRSDAGGSDAITPRVGGQFQS